MPLRLLRKWAFFLLLFHLPWCICVLAVERAWTIMYKILSLKNLTQRSTPSTPNCLAFTSVYSSSMPYTRHPTKKKIWSLRIWLLLLTSWKPGTWLTRSCLPCLLAKKFWEPLCHGPIHDTHLVLCRCGLSLYHLLLLRTSTRVLHLRSPSPRPTACSASKRSDISSNNPSWETSKVKRFGV